MLPPRSAPMAPPTAPPMASPMRMPGQMALMPAPVSRPPVEIPPSDVIDAEYRLLVTAEESNIGPKPPPWYVPWPKPTAEQIKAEANLQKEMHAQRVMAQAAMELRLGMEISAIFDSDAMWVAAKEIEPQASQLLRIMHDAITNFVATQTVQFTSLARGLVHREERAAIEDHLDDSLRDWREQHFNEGQGTLLRTLTADALSGMVAVYHAPDPGNERTGQRLYRVDPKVVFPVFGRNGVDAVYVVYDATYVEVMRDFSDGLDEDPVTGKVTPNPKTAAIQKIARKGQGSGRRLIDTETTRELIGYWDRTRAVITWDGEVIDEWDHNLYVVPWHIGVPNWRQRGGTKAAGGYSPSGDRTGPLISVDGVSVPYNGVSLGGTRQTDIVRMYEPFLGPWITTIDKIEKGMTRTGYGVDRALDWPTVWKRASSNSGSGTPEIQNYRGGVTEIEEDEELDALPMNPMSDSFEPWMQMLQIEIQAAIPVPILQGQTIGTQASGNAIDVINEMGYTHFAPVPEFMQLFLGSIAHRGLTYIRDWNPTYSSPGGEGLAVPSRSQHRYGADPLRLTAEMLERAGCYIDCTLSRFSLAGAAAAATAAAVLDQQLHIGTRPMWISKFGLTSNAQQLDDDRRQQDLEDTPGFVEGRAIEYLYNTMKQAAALDDEDSLRTAAAMAKRVAAKQTMHDMALAKMSGMMPAQPEPMPGELPGNTGGGGANPVPYLSAPQQGGATGTEGGAPSTTPAAPLAIPGQG
jgi:hypothetical protein